jgi:hypothetical protein
MFDVEVKQLASYSRSNSNLSVKAKQQDETSSEFKKMKNGLLNTQVGVKFFLLVFTIISQNNVEKSNYFFVQNILKK